MDLLNDGEKTSHSILFLAFNVGFLLSFIDGEFYAGTSVDFMGANAAIFRTSVQGSRQRYIRTEAYDQNWLNGEKLLSHRDFANCSIKLNV